VAGLPEVKVSLKGAQRLRAQQPWVYRQDVAKAPEGLPAGAVVRVVDPQGNPVGAAFWATKSPLALRLLTRERVEIDDAFFKERLKRSLLRRHALAARDGMRLVHGEADLLPGLFVDRYGAGLTLQTLSEGADVRKEQFAKWLVELTSCTHVVCRDDASGRDFEQLPRESKALVGSAPFRFEYHEGENRFEVDLLDAAANGHGKLVEARHANAFDVLHGFDREGRQFDTVVIDPPGLAKRKEGVQTALRAYRELNLRALRCLKPDGLLVTCSCSGKVTREMFEEMVLAAAKDAKRPVQILERRGAGSDHPVLGTLPETEYLKALFVRAL
jgi:23S rRNA (cytosine1962-C5)-methyltransferase